MNTLSTRLSTRFWIPFGSCKFKTLLLALSVSNQHHSVTRLHVGHSSQAKKLGYKLVALGVCPLTGSLEHSRP